MAEQSRHIHLFDSHFSGMGLGFQVIAACEMLAAGKSIEEVLEALKTIRDKIRLFFVVDNLEYLAREAVGTISCKLGTLIQLKPVLSLENGQLALFQKSKNPAPSHGRGLGPTGKDRDNIQRIAILNVEHQEKAQELRINWKQIPSSCQRYLI